MKSLTTWSNISLLILLLLSSMPATAQVLFRDTGTILALNRNSINISDSQYKLSPTVKIALVNNNPDDEEPIKGELSQLKIGNYVQVTVIRINQRRYVDTITVLSETSPNKVNGK